MKTLFAIAGMLFLMMFPPAHQDFSGNWKLDVKKSVNLPSSFAQVELYTMNIRQTADSMIIVISLTGSGQSVVFPMTNYLFNGAEVFREDSIRQSKRWVTCAWADDGKQLVVTSRVEQGLGEKKKEYTQRDEWKMPDPSTFQISVMQKFAHSDSTRSESRIFRRMK